jgi:hypothetical protein
MKRTANCLFALKSWDEMPFGEGSGLPKLTHAVVVKALTSDIVGEGHVECLMMCRADGWATDIGLERIIGRIVGKAGSFALHHTGAFENGVAKGSYAVVRGSGTGELASLQGQGTTAVGHGTEFPFALDYEFG